MTWQANSGAQQWREHRCQWCPHAGHIGPEQMWKSLRRETERLRPTPWDAPSLRAWMPEATRTERAVAWLWFVFGGRNAAPRG